MEEAGSDFDDDDDEAGDDDGGDDDDDDDGGGGEDGIGVLEAVLLEEEFDAPPIEADVSK